MRPIIEFCTSNLASGTLEIMRYLERNLAIDVLEYDCLNHCRQCSLSPYALVDGEVVAADTPEELLAKIKQVVLESAGIEL